MYVLISLCWRVAISAGSLTGAFARLPFDGDLVADSGLSGFVGAPSSPPGIWLRVLKNAGWVSVLFIVLDIRFSPYRITDKARHLLALGITGILGAMLVSGLTYGLGESDWPLGNWLVLGQVLISVSGLVLLEQVWRNESYYKRSNIRYLCLGIGALFALRLRLIQRRPCCSIRFRKHSGASSGTLCAPLIAMTMVNSARQPLFRRFPDSSYSIPASLSLRRSTC